MKYQFYCCMSLLCSQYLEFPQLLARQRCNYCFLLLLQNYL
jgi:hypothetical protein